MNRPLRKIGNSSGVIIPKDVMELLGWNSATQVEFAALGDGRLMLSKVDIKPSKPTVNLFSGAKTNGEKQTATKA